MRIRTLLQATVAILAMGWATTTLATVITVPVLDEHFLDGNLSNGTTNGENDTAWFAIASAGGTAWGTTTDSTTPLSGSVMRNNGGTMQNTKMNGDFPGGAITLSAPGDRIVLTLDCRVNFTTAPTGGAFQMILGNNNGTPMTANEIGTATNSADDQLLSFSMNNTTYFTTTAAHSIRYALELAANGTDLIRTITYDNTTIDTTTISTPVTLSFNEVRFGWNVTGGSGVSERLDNIVVVPEPALASVLGITGLGLLCRSRRAGGGRTR